MLSKIRLDALLLGFISMFVVIVLNMLGMAFILGLLSELISSDLLYTLLRGFGIISLAIPAYITARTAASNELVHSLIIGFIQALMLIALMTQTASWEGPMQNSIVGNMPIIFIAMLLLCLVSGFIARWVNQKNKT